MADYRIGERRNYFTESGTGNGCSSCTALRIQVVSAGRELAGASHISNVDSVSQFNDAFMPFLRDEWAQ
jgi:hypothetical protein